MISHKWQTMTDDEKIIYCEKIIAEYTDDQQIKKIREQMEKYKTKKMINK